MIEAIRDEIIADNARFEEMKTRMTALENENQSLKTELNRLKVELSFSNKDSVLKQSSVSRIDFEHPSKPVLLVETQKIAQSFEELNTASDKKQHPNFIRAPSTDINPGKSSKLRGSTVENEIQPFSLLNLDEKNGSATSPNTDHVKVSARISFSCCCSKDCAQKNPKMIGKIKESSEPGVKSQKIDFTACIFFPTFPKNSTQNRLNVQSEPCKTKP